MIDGLATIIQFLKTKSVELGTDQIASRHRFAETGGWAAESAGIVVRRDGGPVDLYSALQIVRCEVRIYGGDSVEAGSIYGELVAVLPPCIGSELSHGRRSRARVHPRLC